MTAYQPQATDFEPAAPDAARTLDWAASAPKSRGAWQRLRSNHRALAALWLVIGLLVFTLLGPALWPLDPSAQDLTQISMSPSFNRRALLIDAHAQPGPAAVAPAQFSVAGVATTHAVTLHWPSMGDARSHVLYRHELEPSGPLDLGLPLAELSADRRHYQDLLMLEPMEYYYTLVALDDTQAPLLSSTISVSVRQALTRDQARELGLLDPHDNTSSSVRLPAHPLGTDYLGRDMLARLIHGARTSLFIGILAPLAYTLFGMLYGGLAGLIGGAVDRELMRLADFVLALPFLLFMILFKVLFGLGPGQSGIGPMLVALVLLSWPACARLVRGQVLQIRQQPYIEAAQLLGAGPAYLILRHILPNLAGVVLVSLSFAIPSAIFIEAFLSFIGMGVVPPTPSWGSMCNEGIRSMLTHPHELLFPALFISLTVLAFNLLGDGLRDALDARSDEQR